MAQKQATICFNCMLNDPYQKQSLTCLHSLCLTCFKDQYQKQHLKYKNLEEFVIICPICRTQARITDEELKATIKVQDVSQIQKSQVVQQAIQQTFVKTLMTNQSCQECQKYKAQVENLVQNNNTYQLLISEKNKQISSQEDKVKYLENQLQQGSITNQQNQFSAEQSKMSLELQNTIQSQQKEIERLQNEITAKEYEIQRANNEQKLQLENQHQESQIKMQIQMLSKENQQLKDQQMDLSNQVLNLTQQKQNLETRCQDQESKISQQTQLEQFYQSQISQPKQNIDQNEQAQPDFTNYQILLKQKQEQENYLAQILRENVQLKVDFQNIQQQIQNQGSQVPDLNFRNVEEQKLQIDLLLKEKEQLQQQIQQLQVDYQSQRLQLQECLQNLQAATQNSQANIEESWEQLNLENKNQRESQNNGQQRDPNLESQIKELQVQLNIKEKQVNQSNIQLQLLRKQIAQLEQNSKAKGKTQTTQLLQVYPRQSLSSLSEEYKHSSSILNQIENLKQKFNSFTRIRGDGNCYYRAVGFSFFEHLMRVTTPIQHLKDLIQKLESNQGYYQIRPNLQNNSHNELRQIFMKFLYNLEQQKKQGDENTLQYLFSELKDNKSNQDEAFIWQMRCLTANYLESHRELYENFCIQSFSQTIQDILTMGKEADSLAIGPLQVILNVKIDIVSMDKNTEEALQIEQIKIQGKIPQIYILLKPGHYDIIYSREQSDVDGFDEISETFSKQKSIPYYYDIKSLGKPFYVKIEQTGQECPKDEFKQFQIQYSFLYKSAESSILIIENPLYKCLICSIDYEKQYFDNLECNHLICKICLTNQIKKDTFGRIVWKEGQRGKRPNCPQCQRTLTTQEIENAIGKEEYEKALSKYMS